jgi:predicted ATPase
MLLVLDNFEQLVDGAALVGELLEGARGLKVLVTSRERLCLQEEWLFEVRGLAFPTSDREREIEGYGAVQLFVQSARRVCPNFRLAPQLKGPVGRICRLVGGMPLAIELASAWARSLPAEEIAREIERSLDVLESSARNVLPRHRNMRAAFEPTWCRLSDEERQLFLRLSAIRGGFTREAAEVIAGATRRCLSSLVDKSLLRLDSNGHYAIHELLRQYGEEQLNARPAEREETLDRHRAYFMGRLAECEQKLVFLGQPKAALAIMKNELDNMRQAWHRAVLQGRYDELGRTAEGLWTFY